MASNCILRRRALLYVCVYMKVLPDVRLHTESCFCIGVCMYVCVYMCVCVCVCVSECLFMYTHNVLPNFVLGVPTITMF